jgi:hypothetical protein
MLATVLIMSLVMLAITGGVLSGTRVYKQIRQRANAQVLLATASASLNADFASATEIKDGYHFHSGARGYDVAIANGEETVNIAEDDDKRQIPLVTEKTRGNLKISIDVSAYPDGSKDYFTYTLTIQNNDNENAIDPQTINVTNIASTIE